MQKKIKFAVIGTSGIAPAHIKCLKRNHMAELTHIYSRNSDRAGQFAERFGLIGAKSYEEILNDDTIDAVVIVTEPSRHAFLALEAISHGKHVLIEKPLDTDIKLAERVVSESEKSGKTVGVISQMRFDPTLKAMREEYRKGVIGKAFYGEVKLMWARDSNYYSAGDGWRGREGNVLINQAVHWIDIAVWFFGTPVKTEASIKKIKKDITCYDTAVCTFLFPDDISFNLSCSTAVNISRPDEFRIYGTEGVLNYCPGKNAGIIKRILSKILKRKNSKSPFQSQIDDFVDAIVNEREPEVSAVCAYNVLKIIKTCEENAGSTGP